MKILNETNFADNYALALNNNHSLLYILIYNNLFVCKEL